MTLTVRKAQDQSRYELLDGAAIVGIADYVSDGDRTFAIANGHEYLGKITGVG